MESAPRDVYKRQEEHWSKDKLTFTMESEAERNYWETALAMLKHECPQFFDCLLYTSEISEEAATMSFTFAVKPEVKLGEYKGLAYEVA